MVDSQKESSEPEFYLIAKDEMEDFMERCMLAAGAKKDHAKSLASCMMAGDYRGHYSHGLNRMGKVNKLSNQAKALGEDGFI